MWKNHPSCHLDKIEDIFNTPKETDIGYFFEVDLKYPEEIKEKLKNFSILS